MFLELILEKEVDLRRINKVRMLKGKCGLKVDDSIYSFKSYKYGLTENVSKWHLEKLQDLALYKKYTNIIISGATGVGKTHLAKALTKYAVENTLKTYYTTLNDLIYLIKTKDEIKLNKTKYDYIKTCDIVILDEFGYVPYERSDAIEIYNLINMINNYASLVIVTNREFSSWKDIFYDEVIASTILDRLIENVFILNIKAESYRLKLHLEEEEDEKEE